MDERERPAIVCGGRSFAYRWFLYDWLDFLHRKKMFTNVIEGGATGADTLAREWAKSRWVPCSTVPAEWEKHGRRAGPIRNAEMLKLKPGLVVAFPGGAGTADMVRQAKAAGVLTVELSPPADRQGTQKGE